MSTAELRRPAAPAARPPAPVTPAREPRWPLAVVVLAAAALRFARLGRVPLDAFYDAAVRSMGMSWHTFITGAIDPSARVAIDKPPVDLWLQVLSTRVLGFTPFALHLPEAVAGTLAVLVLHDALRTLFGRRPALAGAAVLAVSPMAVLTARSDTMDSVMTLLVLVALALTARSLMPELSSGRRRGMVALAGIALGLAFEVKLFEALVAAPALVAVWWWGSAQPVRARLGGLALASVLFAGVAVSWLVVSTLAGGPHPWAFGSTNGSAWNATFVYDGIDRLRGLPSPASGGAVQHAAELAHAPSPPGPLRLLGAGAHLGRRVGVVLVPALLAIVLALVAGVPRGLDRRGRAGWWALLGWLGAGVVLLSAEGGLKPRYLAAVDPALAAVLGVGVTLVVDRLRRTWPAARGVAAGAPAALHTRLPVALLAAALVLPTAVSVGVVRADAEDAGSPGALPAARLGALSVYLRGHRDGARYEAATSSVGKAASLIARDGLPVLPLTTAGGRPLVGVGELATAVGSGAVRYAVVGSPCARRSPERAMGCSATDRWIRVHGSDVSRAAGQPRPGLLYALAPPAPRALGPLTPGGGTRSGSGTSRGSRRSSSARSRRPHRASRGLGRRRGRAARRSRRHSRSSAAR